MIFDQRPFYQTISCVGTIYSEKDYASDIQIEIEYPETKTGKIRGKVIGTSDDSSKVSRLSKASSLRMEAKRLRGDTDVYIESNSVTITSLNQVIPPDDRTVRIIAQIKILDLKIKKEKTQDIDSSEPRKLLYFIEGPENPWRNIVRYDWKEIKESEEINEELDLGLDLPFGLFVTKEPFTDSDPDSSTTYERTVLTLGAETELPEDKLSTAQFVEQADLLVDDLLLLVSFASKQWTVWFSSQLITSEEIRDRVQTTSRTVRDHRPADNMVPVRPNDMLDFLRAALPKYRDFRSEDSDMRTAIQSTLSSREENYVETQFLSLFTALETLKNIFAEREEVEYLLDGTDFNEMKDDLKEVVRDHLGRGNETSDMRSEVYQSMQALNRRSLRSLLDGMFEKYNTEIADLYPQGTNPSLKQTRNDLVHGRGAPEEVGKLADEVSRLQALVNRLTLRMLGWEDISQCPPDVTHERLASAE